MSNSSLCSWDQAVQTVNLTPETYPTTWVSVIFYPVLLVLCTFGNIAIVTLLLVDPQRKSTTVYLLGMALADLCVLWFGLPDYIMDTSAFMNRNISDETTATYLAYKGFGDFWRETCIQFADWTLIVFSLERLMAVQLPLTYRSSKTYSLRRSVLLVTVLFILSMICELENLVSTYYFRAHDDGHSAMQDILPPELLTWYTIQNNAEVGLVIAKWIALTLINIFLLLGIRSHYKYLRSNTSQSLKRPGRITHATLITLGLLALYTITQFPNVVYKSLQIASRPPYCTFQFSPEADQVALPLINTALIANYSLAFYVFCIMSLKFRRRIMGLRRSSEAKPPEIFKLAQGPKRMQKVENPHAKTYITMPSTGSDSTTTYFASTTDNQRYLQTTV